MNIVRALMAARPGEKWTLPDNDFNKLIWLDVTSAPTLSELQTAWDALVQKEQKEESDNVAGRQFAKLNALKSMSPSQVQSWVQANVTNLAQAKDAIETLAVAVSLLARRL